MALVNLAKFGLHGKISLINVIKEVCKKWLLDDYIISNKTDLITSIITNLGINIANYFKKSIVICLYQVLKVDQPDENDIQEISKETIQNWKRMINKGGKLPETNVNVIDTGYKIDDNNSVEVLEPIYGKIWL